MLNQILRTLQTLKEKNEALITQTLDLFKSFEGRHGKLLSRRILVHS